MPKTDVWMTFRLPKMSIRHVECVGVQCVHVTAADEARSSDLISFEICETGGPKNTALVARVFAISGGALRGTGCASIA